MSRPILLSVLLILAFVGMADAWYLSMSALTDTALSCDLGAVLDGCNIVAKSAFSHFFGLPLAMYGVAFFAVVFVITAIQLITPHKTLFRLLYALGVLGSAASIVFLFIQIAVIKALCIYCIASAIITFLIWLVSHDLWKRMIRAKAAYIAPNP